MNATTAARPRAVDVCPAADGAADAPVSRAAQAEDFAALLLQALDDALNAMAHPSPDQYLHLVAAQRRCRPPAIRPRAGGRAEAGAAADARNAVLVRELGAHLAVEFLNCARRHAALLGSIGDYGDPARTSCRPGTGRGAVVS